MHTPEAIAKVVADTGMDAMQARYHLQGRAAVRASLHGRPYRPAPRNFTVCPQSSWLRGYRETVYALRCYGSGVACIADGQRSIYRDEAEAIRKGAAWVETGIAPCHQGTAYGLPIANEGN